MKRSKSYQAVKEKMPTESIALSAAVELIQRHARAGFDETIELHARLGSVDTKSGEVIRGNVVLPHGTPKKMSIAVFTDDAKAQKAAQEAGATIVGGEDLITKIAADGSINADVAIASPDMMPKIAKVAKILGPRGLMPNPKNGTVAPDVAAVVKDLSAGKIAFKMDPQANIHESVGKVSWESQKIVENAQVLVDAIAAARPAGMKGGQIESLTITTTMGPAVSISL